LPRDRDRPRLHHRAELDGDFGLFRTTSDEYFSRPDPLAATRGVPFDLSFIDGLHLFEYALRDFIFAERHSSARGMIIFDDVLPRTIDEAARERHTGDRTGDVFGVLAVLERYRPDLVVLPLDTKPTGLLAVVGLDASSTVLATATARSWPTSARRPTAGARGAARPPERLPPNTS